MTLLHFLNNEFLWLAHKSNIDMQFFNLLRIWTSLKSSHKGLILYKVTICFSIIDMQFVSLFEDLDKYNKYP